MKPSVKDFISVNGFALGLCYEFFSGIIYNFLPCPFGISLLCKDLEQFCKYAEFFISGNASVCILIILLPIYLFISSDTSFSNTEKKKKTLLGNSEEFQHSQVFDVCANSLIFLCPSIS